MLFKFLTRSKEFDLIWNNFEDWHVSIIQDRISPSYGIVQNSQTLRWEKTGKLCPFQLTLMPVNSL